MRILWCSNYTVRSAYAFQSQMILERLPRTGHQATVFDIRHGGSGVAQIGGNTILPAFNDPLGADSIPQHAARSRSDAVITLVDVWGLNPAVMSEVAWFPIAPIDHQPVPPAVLNSLKAARGVIALSRSGQRELKKVGVDSWYVPHGVDPAVWYPALTRDEVLAARRTATFAEDKFIVSFVGVNDSNPSRKGIAELLMAWAAFQPKHPNALLYMHTLTTGNIPLAGVKSGIDIPALISSAGIDPHSVIFPDQYRLRTGIPADELATIIRASDALVLPSRGEGFGVPLIEAQHAGTPVITTDFAAGAELCASGWLIDYESSWSWQNAAYAQPGITSITERLEDAYSQQGNEAIRRQAAEFGRDYAIDRVFERFVAPTLGAIAEMVVAGSGTR